jgi:uncharacterized protein
MNGCNFILDVNSLCVHIVDDLAYDLVDYLSEDRNFLSVLEDFKKKKNVFDEFEIEECFNEIYELKRFGKLFSEFSDFSDANKVLPFKSMCLNVAHDCNLRCKYCFASDGNFGEEKMLMPFEVAKASIDFLIKNSKNRYNLEVDFFGGEPLMNFEIVKKVVNYARNIEEKYKKNFRFTITTNGMLLDDEKIDFINKEISNVVLSLDGRKFVNDNFRITSLVKGTYDRIVPLYKKLVDKRKNKDYYIRGTFTKKNLDFTNDILHIASLGFRNISVEPVVSVGNLDYSITSDDVEKICKEYEKLANILLKAKNNKKIFTFFHFLVDIDAGPCAVKRMRGCGCGNEYFAVTPKGDIFPCHQFVGESVWKMGNVIDGSFNRKIKLMLSKVNINTKEDCKNCFAKFYCSGGCAANSWKYEGDIFKGHKISCKLQKKRTECAIMIQSFKKIKNSVFSLN